MGEAFSFCQTFSPQWHIACYSGDEILLPVSANGNDSVFFMLSLFLITIGAVCSDLGVLLAAKYLKIK